MNVEVEICVFKPTGYGITYFVKGTDDRWAAVLLAVDHFEKQGPGHLTRLNNISAKLCDRPARGAIKLKYTEDKKDERTSKDQ